MNKVKEERLRQIMLGYTLQHDREMGWRHLLGWSMRYFLRGKFVKGAAMLIALRDTFRRGAYTWTVENGQFIIYGIKADTEEQARQFFENLTDRWIIWYVRKEEK